MCCNVRKTPNSPTALIIALHGGTYQAIPGLLVHLTQTHLLWHLGKLQGTNAHKFQPITLKIAKTTDSCNTKKVLFDIIFETNLRSCQILPPGSSLLHVSTNVLTLDPRLNSTTCPNAAQYTRPRDLKKLVTVKPPTHRMATFYNSADPSAGTEEIPHTCRRAQRGPSPTARTARCAPQGATGNNACVCTWYIYIH